MYYRLELLPTEEGRPYYSNADLPDENAGFDMFVVKEYNATEMALNAKPCLFDLGTAARLVCVTDAGEKDVHYWLTPRSSVTKAGMMMANSIGVIDQSYRGTLMAPVWVVAQAPFMKTFETQSFKGSRFFQIVTPDMGWIKEVRIVDSLPATIRGTGGFGSTGK
jgi:dUTPase